MFARRRLVPPSSVQQRLPPGFLVRPTAPPSQSRNRVFTFSRGFLQSTSPTSSPGTFAPRRLQRPRAAQSAAGTLGASLLRFSQPFTPFKPSELRGFRTSTRTIFVDGTANHLSPSRGTNPAYHFQQQSSSSTALIVLASGLALSVLLYMSQSAAMADNPSSSSQPPPQPSNPTPAASTSTPSNQPTHALLPGVVLDEDMADSTAPGRPGNLTPEEEVKLKETWALMNQLFGLHGDADSAATPAATTENVPPSPTAEKKKSRFSIWGRNKEPEPAPKPSTAGGVDLTSIEADDKYGLSKDFKETLATLSKEEIRDSFWKMTKHDHPDAVLLRFLRARKWDVNAALVMGVSTLKWRLRTFKLDDELLIGGEPAEIKLSQSSNAKEKKEGEDYIKQWEMGKSFIHGVDAEERPICYVRVRLHHGGDQGVDPLERYIVHTIETARFMLRPPVDTATLVFDMTGFSLANMDYTPVKFMIKCFEANYPESLGLILIHNAPWVFQGVWKIIKGWMDPVVSSKVNFTSGVEGMSEYIPVDQIPKELGGDEDWEYKYVPPQPNENEKLADTATRDTILAQRKTLSDKFENATIRWIKGDEAAKAERTQIALELKKNYWELDPYIRARSFYDAPRSCIINPGGVLDYYPSEKKAEEPTADIVNGELAQKLDEKAVVTDTTETTPATNGAVTA